MSCNFLFFLNEFQAYKIIINFIIKCNFLTKTLCFRLFLREYTIICLVKKKLTHHQAQALPGPSRTDGGAQKD
jgi:hypothetical protein